MQIGFLGLLTIVLIVLQLIGVIAWPWVWVLSPLWIGLLLWLGLVAFIIVMAIFTEVPKSRSTYRW